VQQQPDGRLASELSLAVIPLAVLATPESGQRETLLTAADLMSAMVDESA
jgi:hypothetical protein